MHSQIDDYLALGISIEYYGFPRDGLQTQVFEDMQSAWCSDDPKLSITKLKAGDDVEKKHVKIQFKCTMSTANYWELLEPHQYFLVMAKN